MIPTKGISHTGVVTARYIRPMYFNSIMMSMNHIYDAMVLECDC